MIKLIATDIDGTLLKDGTLMIDPEYMTVIEKLTSKGIIFVACSGKEWMDCNPLGVNKGTAIRFLQEYLGIAPDETCTFGDNLNDIEMLESAGTSYAVSNAREEVIAAAKRTCAPYWENGVLQVLKTFL